MSDTFTTSQTIGPFFHDGLRWATEQPASTGGLVLEGVVRDGKGQGIGDALLEFWVPSIVAGDTGASTPGWRRIYTDAEGMYTLRLPASAADSDGPLAWLTLFARGLLKHQFSAVFIGDDAGTARSEVLAQVAPARRSTLVASRRGPEHYHWDIVLQGDPARETVFFDYR